MHTLKNNKKKITRKIIFIFTAITIFLIHQKIFLSYLDIGSFHFDWINALSRLTFGKIWFLNNGFAVPWFSPHVCCGVPYFANPQSEYFSPIQILFLFLKPLTTMKVTFFLYSFISFLGSFLLLRKIFIISYNSCLIGATIFLFNHYFAFHYLSGHIGWGLFSIIPMYFYIAALSLKQKDQIKSYFLIFISSVIFALMMHSGGSRIILEILISIFFLTLIHLIYFKNLKIIQFVIISVLVGLLISSSKIYAAWSFVEKLSRDVEPIYFNSIGSFITIFSEFFFLFPRAQIESDMASIVGHLSIVEFSFNVSILPIVIFLFYLKNYQIFIIDKFRIISIFLLITSILILILLNFSNTLLGSLIRYIPFITNDWISFRMLSPLIILFFVYSAIMFDQISFKKYNFITFLFISIIIIQNLFFDRNELYKVFRHTTFGDLFKKEITKKNINEFKIKKIVSILDNDVNYLGPNPHYFFLENSSIQFCYFSIFGYDLEALKPIVKDLVFNYRVDWVLKNKNQTYNNTEQEIFFYEGDPLYQQKNNLNFINPSCYLNPDENNCKNNFLFKTESKDQLIKFLEYKPFKFKHLKLQKAFNYISIISLLITLIFIFYYLVFYVFIKKNPSRN